jgi:hypothetical protein
MSLDDLNRRFHHLDSIHQDLNALDQQRRSGGGAAARVQLLKRKSAAEFYRLLEPAPIDDGYRWAVGDWD